VALAVPLHGSPGSYSLTRVNVNHLEPGHAINLCLSEQQRVEVQAHTLVQHALAQLWHTDAPQDLPVRLKGSSC